MKYDITIKNLYGVDNIMDLEEDKRVYLEEVARTLEGLLYEYTSKNQQTMFIIALKPRKDLE